VQRYNFFSILLFLILVVNESFSIDSSFK
jgi:hypothetical protein